MATADALNWCLQLVPESSSGTGDLALNSHPSSKYRDFSTAAGTGSSNDFEASIIDPETGDRETSICHIDGTSGDLVRDTVLESTNSDSKVDFAGNVQLVFGDISAQTLNAILGATLVTTGDESSDFENSNQHPNLTGSDLHVPKNSGVANIIDGYLQPDGLVIANDSGSPNTIVNVETGGRVYVEQPDDDSNHEIVELAGTESFDISTTGAAGRINSSSRTADTWYELGVIADSSGSNSPAIVGYTDANRPTASADLPTGYDLFRAMGTPGKTWWVRTDGSSNILDFRHNSDGVYGWTTTSKNSFSRILSTPTVQTTWTSITTTQVPPVPVRAILNHVQIRSDGTGITQISLASDNDTSATANIGEVEIVANSAGDQTSQASVILSRVTGQEFFWAITFNDENFDRVLIEKITEFEAVN